MIWSIMEKKKRKQRKPSKKELEFLAYALPWRLHVLLPQKYEDRDTLVKEIIELWEKIREK